MKINISRLNSPKAMIHVEIISQQENKPGKDKPVAFILPGGPGADHTAYTGYTCLKRVTDLVFHDPRGCGQSSKNDISSCTMDNYIDDVESIRQHLSLEKIILIGKSYGAMCALGYAIRYPHAVAKLVLSAGAPSSRFLATSKENIHRHGTPEQIRIYDKLSRGELKNADDVLTYFQLTNTLYSVKARTQPEAFDLAKKSRMFSYEVLNEGFRQSFWHFDYENELRNILCPTLILVGEEDWITDAKFSEFMVKRIPHSQLLVFDNASHAMEADVPEVYFQSIADFISN